MKSARSDSSTSRTPSAPIDDNIVESFDGTSWTEIADLNADKHNLAAAKKGTTTAALMFGGLKVTTAQAVTESWDGSSWTELADLGSARYALGGAGIQTDAVAFGGAPAVAITESWNGSSWTEVADLSTGRHDFGYSGTSASAFAASGSSIPTATEVWSQAAAASSFTSN